MASQVACQALEFEAPQLPPSLLSDALLDALADHLAGDPVPPAEADAVRPRRGASTNGSRSSPLADVRDSRAVRARAYGLRTASRSLVGDIHDSVACCGYVRHVFRRYGAEGADPDLACLVVDPDTGRATYADTTRCNSPWACPVCAPRLASARGQALQPQVAGLMERGWSAWLITLTVRHTRGDSLVDLLSALRKAWGRATSGKRWQAVRDAGALEYVRGYDVTHGEGAGWHPHLHLSLYLAPEHEDPEGVARAFADRWRAVLGRLGWEALPGAQHVTRANDPEAAAKYAVTPAACYETVALALKRARSERAGRTPFELLDAAAGGDARARELWREYVAATKGRRQVSTSQGITLKPEVEDLEERAGQPVADIGTHAMVELDRRRLAAPLLDAVERAAPGDRMEAAAVILRTLEAGDWGLCRGPPDGWELGPVEYPPWPPPDPHAGLSARERMQAVAYQAWQEARDT